MTTLAQTTNRVLTIEAQEAARQAWETAQEYLQRATDSQDANDQAYWEQAARWAQMDGKNFTSQAIWGLTKAGV